MNLLPPQPPRKPRQSGSVLWIALTAVMAIATLTSLLFANYQQSLNTVVQQKTDEQLQQYVLTAIDWVCLILVDHRRLAGGDRDDLQQQWATPIQALPIDLGGAISGKLNEQSGLINLNALIVPGAVGEATQDALLNLLTANANLDLATAANTVAAIRESLNSEGAAFGQNNAEPSRSIPRRLMKQSNELMQVRGIDFALFSALQPFITVLPLDESNLAAITEMRLNPNTAPLEVLQAVLGPSQASRIVQERDIAPFKSLADVFNRLQLQDTAPWNLTPRSDFFLFRGATSFAATLFKVESLLYRHDAANKSTCRVVWVRWI